MPAISQIAITMETATAYLQEAPTKHQSLYITKWDDPTAQWAITSIIQMQKLKHREIASLEYNGVWLPPRHSDSRAYPCLNPYDTLLENPR